MNYIVSIKKKKYANDNKKHFLQVVGDLSREKFVQEVKAIDDDFDLRTVKIVEELSPIQTDGVFYMHELNERDA